MITINMNSAALCRLEQQDRTRQGALAGSGTAASADRRDAPPSEAVPPMPEHTRG
ncbi:hypothetical protein [Kocuria sp. NPDC057446]|uniref:hypothetical protein n=1 Tax=Kocuria sp. NPDC057446 TaxID=3346137 RepID=UPI0036C35554